MARILISTPLLAGMLSSLAGHELIQGAARLGPAGAGADLRPDRGRRPRRSRSACRGLRVISVAGAGPTASTIIAAQRTRDTGLTSGEALVESTADLAFGLIIAASRLMGDRAGAACGPGILEGWRFIEEQFGRDVHGARLGLVGYGAIARALGAQGGRRST